MLKITDPRLLQVFEPTVERTLTVYQAGEELPLVGYWQSRPPDERIAAIMAAVGDLTDMRPTLDMLEFVEYLNRRDVRYLVVGGYALGFHGHPRYTKDLDIWIERTPENADRLALALADFGLSLSAEEKQAFIKGGPIRIGRPPNLLDIIGPPDGVVFDECYQERETTTFETIKIEFISKRHFLQNKRASGRLRDLADVEDLLGTGEAGAES
ncbi:MAG: hypothetical protein L0332_14845 [Chloroflexi bacterium]|nr:hypothetical protein [Chloroflexota bacterium]MCI0580465.1 hypothetical protein [Chloroflexota bacterium]MCI0649209.1 hypothetical protein [Chloroflexota bacterium]MCI0727979.1 hypothetical protein [Chloroflexota bacterium]